MTEILCTIGPASLNPRTLRRLEALGVNLFRINLSHTHVEDVEAVITAIQRASNVSVCLDSEGAQVRTGTVAAGTSLAEGDAVRLTAAPPTAETDIQLTPPATFEALRPGDLVSIDFKGALVQIVTTGEVHAMGRVVHGGAVGTNKAVSLNRDIVLPAITPKDRQAIAIGLRLGVRHFALSFANEPSDVDAMRSLIGNDTQLIAKIESIRGLQHLEGIAQRADALLIDRGDLSRQVPITRIPQAQKMICARARTIGKPVYVATNLLESMIGADEPTRAEVNDIYNTLEDGASGLVLAAETAIGAHPVECAAVVREMIDVWHDRGGRLMRSDEDGDESVWLASERSIEALPSLTLPTSALLDAEQLALGGYLPLRTFMTTRELEAVLTRHQMPNGETWALPILLQIHSDAAGDLRAGGFVRLNDNLGITRSVLEIDAIEPLDIMNVAARMFGCATEKHPGVARFIRAGNVIVSGKTYLVSRLPLYDTAPVFSPRELRSIFQRKRWRRVIGFHTRNIPHRGHEIIQAAALDRSAADGLLVSPTLAPGKSGDFRPEIVMQAHKASINARADACSTLAAFPSWPRFAGPREAVFTAQARKNMGCTHFIVGRDHSGVGDYYEPDASVRLFDAVGDIGIEVLSFDAIGYVPEHGYVEGSDPAGRAISASLVRELLARGETLPEWLVHPAVTEMLAAARRRGEPLFCD
jgi:ATP sulfurylase